jgi:hypothetical protein
MQTAGSFAVADWALPTGGWTNRLRHCPKTACQIHGNTSHRKNAADFNAICPVVYPLG